VREYKKLINFKHKIAVSYKLYHCFKYFILSNVNCILFLHVVSERAIIESCIKQNLYCYATPYFYNQNLRSKLQNFGHKKNLLISQEVLLVDNSIQISNIYFTPRDFELTNYLIKKLVSKDYL